MSLIADGLRASWVQGINAVTGKQTAGIPDWLLRGEYQIYSPIAPDKFELSVAESSEAMAAFAADAARFAVAAIESIEGADRQFGLPKSTGWLAIRAYYAAFFAAHSLMRVFGASCTQIDPEQADRITRLATIFGADNGVTIGSGLFASEFDPSSKTIRFVRLDNGGGTHGGTWRVFLKELRKAQVAVANAGLVQRDANTVIGKLFELEQSLSNYGGLTSGAWLSNIRNRVNYRLEFRAWYPYGDRDDYYAQLFEKARSWKKDSLTLSINTRKGKELHRLVDTAALLVAMSTEVAKDVADRCPRGISFQRYASLALLNQLAEV